MIPANRMYKTIVVDVDGGGGQADRVSAAALFARQYGHGPDGLCRPHRVDWGACPLP